MARITHVKKAQPRYRTIPVIDPETGVQKVTPVLKKNGEQKVTKTGRPVVRRATVEDKTRPLPPETCGACNKPIEIGTPYKWVKPKSGPYGGTKRSRHASCPSWRPSELTSSSALSSVYAAQEAAEDALKSATPEWSADDFKQVLSDCADGVKEGAEAWRESASNIEDGFGHSTSMSDELNDRADQLDSSADELEYVDIDDFDEDAARSEVLDEAEGFWILVNVDDGSPVEESVVYEDESEAQTKLDTLIEGGMAKEGDIEIRDATPEDIDFDSFASLTEAFEAKRQEWFDEAYDKVESAISDIEIP